MGTLSYSFVVPTHNSAGFASRLFDSIPRRDDTEVIVVDDHSAPDELAATRELAVGLPNLVFLESEGRGAGAARNVGIAAARGRWLVFPDSDDYFTAALPAAMDKYAQADCDLVMFRPATAGDVPRTAVFEEMFDRGDIVEFGYTQGSMWSKFIRRDLVEAHRVRCSETMVCNDLYFSVQAFAASAKPVLDPATIYVLTVRPGSLAIREQPLADLVTRADEAVRATQFIRNHAGADWRKAVPNSGYILREAFAWHGVPGLLAVARRYAGHHVPLFHEPGLGKLPKRALSALWAGTFGKAKYAAARTRGE
ncbi:MAG: glycosyltransferase [Propionibacteriaceae bacterium]|jgi:glycosyltransferase involved in cell wall biosynthesis|nr:glycosyltransferase [Propionibacteriaceae bacterium]